MAELCVKLLQVGELVGFLGTAVRKTLECVDNGETLDESTIFVLREAEKRYSETLKELGLGI